MKTGFACGVFDLFHAGHVLMFRDCKIHCDYLVVAINSATNFDVVINKNKNYPIFSVEDRELILNSCKYIDKVVRYESEEELKLIMDKENIDIRFLGSDYIDKPITLSNKIMEIKYINRDHGKSTSGFIKQILNRHENL
jgi:glycerol-3-phosphate cytidylyltransferase